MTHSVSLGRLATALVVAAALCGCLASRAAAEFGPIQLVSKSPKEQAGSGREPALSEDGRFVAFVGELGGQFGLIRKDLTTGAVTFVAGGRREEERVKSPSISADGRFISFTTKQSLDPEADAKPFSEDVYVADLATSPPTFELVSSVDGQRMSGESSAASRVAMSADGTEVAFVNDGQVYVRTISVEEPTLITTKKSAISPEPVAGGGAYQPAGAALSADGNAVAWVGEHLAEQVPLLNDEEEGIRGLENSAAYREPLWRLVPTEADRNPPTRRIIGGGDPLAPGCPAGGTLAEAACDGPFPNLDKSHESSAVVENMGQGWGKRLPQLSADGSTVAVLGVPEEFSDLFVVNMASGLSRIQAMRQLTKWTNPNPAAKTFSEINAYPPYVGPIEECAISPDGRYIAFTTLRQRFEHGSTLVTPLPATASLLPELYQLNLELGTIERVTPGPGTGVSIAGTVGEGAAMPSFSENGRLLAFADNAYNLVSGDANEESDVFLVESTPPAAIKPSTISPPPSSISVIAGWRLSAHAVSRPNGTVRVIATVPGAGMLSVSAKSPLGPRLRSQVVDTANRQAGTGSVIRLDLKLPRRHRELARRKGGLYTWLSLRFAGSGGVPLQQQFAARFRAHHPKAAKKGAGK